MSTNVAQEADIIAQEDTFDRKEIEEYADQFSAAAIEEAIKEDAAAEGKIVVWYAAKPALKEHIMHNL